MGIDFHDQHNQGTYATRSADEGWVQAVARTVDLHGRRVADIGCGGGIYSTAMAQYGAGRVVGVDFSARMVADAQQRAETLGVANVEFRQGTAERTGLPSGSADIVLQRALVHHLDSLPEAFAEARRLLDDGGVLLVQDRTIDDILLPPSPEHLRGWFFEQFPRLIEIEARRRPSAEQIEAALGTPDSALSVSIIWSSCVAPTPMRRNCATTSWPARDARSSTSSTTRSWPHSPSASAKRSSSARPGHPSARSTTGPCGWRRRAVACRWDECGSRRRSSERQRPPRQRRTQQ